MNKNKKTCFNINSNKTKQFFQNKKINKAKNIYMKKTTSQNSDCTLHVMPPQISDQDINILFNGIIGVVRKKFELENKAQILNANINLEKTLKALKEKEAECIRLKNEIIFLKKKLQENQKI